MTTINTELVTECSCNEDDYDFDLDYVDAVADSARDAAMVAANIAVLGLALAGLHASWPDSGLAVLEYLTLDRIINGSVAGGFLFGLISLAVIAGRVRRHRRAGDDR